MTGHSILCSEWVNNYPPFILAELLPHCPILSLLPCQVSGTPNAATVLHSALCPFPHPARDFPLFSFFSLSHCCSPKRRLLPSGPISKYYVCLEFRYKVNWGTIFVDTDVEPKITDRRKRRLCVFYKRGIKRVQR